MKLNMNKKGQRAFTISDLSSIGISLVVLAVVLGLGASILSQIQSSSDTVVNLSNPGSFNIAYNASGSGLSGLNTLASYIPTVALVAVAAVVIGIVITFFSRGN